MKIVKQFEDRDFFESEFYLAFENTDGAWINGHWSWGLGDDGELYCQCTDFERPGDWYDLSETTFGVRSIKQMNKIVKEFGHLLVWL